MFLTRGTPSAYLKAVFRSKQLPRAIQTSWLIGISLGLTGCVHLPQPATPVQIAGLQFALTALHPQIQTNEAAQVATLAYKYPRQLAGEYRLVRPPLFHNLLINVRLKQRGLCYQWAEDLAARLQRLDLESLELHWGVAREGTLREHNTVVITAWNQPFTNGIVLDPWRRSGALVWTAVTNDTYAWVEGVLSVAPPPAPGAAATP